MVIHHKVIDLSKPIIYSYPPTPQASLFFYIDDRIKVKEEGTDNFVEQARSVIVGQQLNSVCIDINKNHKAVRVGFHPGGLFRLLGFSMAEMVDGHYTAEEVFGNDIREVDEQLQVATDSIGIKTIVETFLLKKTSRIKRLLPFDLSMLELLKHNGNLPIEQIASLACVSLRQFERLSKERIGLPPKLYARITRFSKAYRLREEQPQLTWTRIAHECGYFDQMHFIRDFRQFAGITPKLAEKALERQPVRMQAGLRF
jgi:AraC-like DNA-binding protein